MSAVHLKSIRTLRPSVQPRSASACVNAETQVFIEGSFALTEQIAGTSVNCYSSEASLGRTAWSVLIAAAQ
jgi:hypothetical protein